VLLPGRPAEVFGTTSSLFPLNLAEVIASSPSLPLREFRRDGPGLLELMRFRHDRTFARWDGVSFARFLEEQGVRGGMVDVILRPFGKTTLNALERLSAAEAIRFFHAYFMGNPEGLGFRVLGRDVMTAVIEPLERRLADLGVEVRKDAFARRLLVEDGRVAGVTVERGAAPSRAPRWARRRCR